MLVLKTEQYHIRCGSHTGVKAAATALPLLVVRVFGAGRGRWRWVVLAVEDGRCCGFQLPVSTVRAPAAVWLLTACMHDLLGPTVSF